MRHMSSQRRSRQHGFSLVEMSIVMAIISIIVTGGLLAATSFIQRQAQIDTEKQVDKVYTTLRKFHARTGRLPCPANATLSINNASFGLPAPSDCATNNGAGAALSAGNDVRIGAVPTRALGLADDMIADPFGNRLVYAVTTGHTNASMFASTVGAITIAGASGNVATNVSFVVLSTGKNGSKNGAYRYINGSQPNACGAPNPDPADVENCDEDATFIERPFNNGVVVANYFDDTIRFATQKLLQAFSKGNIASECTALSKSIVRYNQSNFVREYCDGTDWVEVPDSAGGVSLLCMAYEEGLIRIATGPGASTVWQVCDSNGEWRDL